MLKYHRAKQWLSRPPALWAGFVLVLVLSGFGLGLLSNHALQLRQRELRVKFREDVQQDIRTALWRLDSRLAPFVATIHDARVTTSETAGPFVRERFRVSRDEVKRAGTVQYVPLHGHGNSELTDFGDALERLEQQVSADALLAAVESLHLPDSNSESQLLVQTYGKPWEDSIAQPSTSDLELTNRNVSVQRQVAINQISQQVADQQVAANFPPSSRPASSSADGTDAPLRLIPIWMHDQLVIVRQAGRGTSPAYEGVWIDWEALRESLLRDVEDLLPGAQLLGVPADGPVDPSRALAALPVMIAPQMRAPPVAPWSTTHTALALSWLAFAVAAIVSALALARLISLSERRATFVSAVTHELRTPLTTFRLYTDLLSRNLVVDPQDRAEYLSTLRSEADRLAHLVDNVLRYSRLERTSDLPALEAIVVSQWIDRMLPRLRTRLVTDEMELEVRQEGDGLWLTDPAAMEQVIFNLIDNAGKYARQATDRTVHFEITVADPQIVLSVRDHGPGVEANLCATLFKPFSKSAQRAAETAAGVGLGLALAQKTVTALGGKLTYRPADGGGALFQCTMPIGDVSRADD